MNFRKAHPSDTEHAHGTSLWSSILRGKGFHDGFSQWWVHSSSQVYGAPSRIPLVPPTISVAEKIFESFQLDVRKLERELCAKRKAFAISRRSQLAHMIFKDIQRQHPDRVDLLLKSSSGTIRQVDYQNAIIFVDMDLDRPLEKDVPIYVAGKCLDVIHLHCDEICVTDAESFEIGQSVRQTTYTGAACDMFQAFEAEWKAQWDRHKDIPVSPMGTNMCFW